MEVLMEKDQILNLIPEIQEIKDTPLREKVVNVWKDAIAYRNWTVDELKSIPFTLLAENVSISFLEHVRTVCKMCIACDDILTEAYHERKTPVNPFFSTLYGLQLDANGFPANLPSGVANDTLPTYV